jgi:hypothetical protein
MTEPGFTVRLVTEAKIAVATAIYRCADVESDVVKRGWVFDMLDVVRGDSRPAPGPFCQFKFLSDNLTAASGWRILVEGGEILPTGVGTP